MLELNRDPKCYLRHMRKTKISALGTRSSVCLPGQQNSDGAAIGDQAGYPGEYKEIMRLESYIYSMMSITIPEETPRDFGFELEQTLPLAASQVLCMDGQGKEGQWKCLLCLPALLCKGQPEQTYLDKMTIRQ